MIVTIGRACAVFAIFFPPIVPDRWFWHPNCAHYIIIYNVIIHYNILLYCLKKKIPFLFFPAVVVYIGVGIVVRQYPRDYICSALLSLLSCCSLHCGWMIFFSPRRVIIVIRLNIYSPKRRVQKPGAPRLPYDKKLNSKTKRYNELLQQEIVWNFHRHCTILFYNLEYYVNFNNCSVWIQLCSYYNTIIIAIPT